MNEQEKQPTCEDMRLELIDLALRIKDLDAEVDELIVNCHCSVDMRDLRDALDNICEDWRDQSEEIMIDRSHAVWDITCQTLGGYNVADMEHLFRTEMIVQDKLCLKNTLIKQRDKLQTTYEKESLRLWVAKQAREIVHSSGGPAATMAVIDMKINHYHKSRRDALRHACVARRHLLRLKNE